MLPTAKAKAKAKVRSAKPKSKKNEASPEHGSKPSHEVARVNAKRNDTTKNHCCNCLFAEQIRIHSRQHSNIFD